MQISLGYKLVESFDSFCLVRGRNKQTKHARTARTRNISANFLALIFKIVPPSYLPRPTRSGDSSVSRIRDTHREDTGVALNRTPTNAGHLRVSWAVRGKKEKINS